MRPTQLSRFDGLSGHTRQMDPNDTFTEHRSYLFGLAYRMTGSVADAEDLVQETWLRWQRAEAEEVRVPRAFLTTVLTRLAISHMDSARVRREEYVGEWIPEPLLTVESRDEAELAESVQMAFLVLLESLSPQERAVFLLAEVFDYSHAEIAAIVSKTEDACRQLLRRARQAVAQRRPRFVPRADAAQQLTARFLQAVQEGRIDALMAMLDESVVVYSDGGGRVRAAMNPIHGPDRAARFLIGIARKRGEGFTRYSLPINDQPGMLIFRDGVAEGAMVLDVEQDRIRAIYIVVNPDKLQRLPKEELIHDTPKP